MDDKWNRYVLEIFFKMFEMVGETFTFEYVKQKDWFLTHTWTDEQEQEFMLWMYEYLGTNDDALFALMGEIDVHPLELLETIAMFLSDFGWAKAEELEDLDEIS